MFDKGNLGQSGLYEFLKANKGTEFDSKKISQLSGVGQSSVAKCMRRICCFKNVKFKFDNFNKRVVWMENNTK